MEQSALDLTTQAPDRWPELVVAGLDALDPGSGLVLRAGGDPRHVLETLQGQRPGSFEWHPLVDGPEQWWIIVARRRGHARPREVMEFMTSDHHRIHDLLHELVQLAPTADPAALETHLGYLETGLRRHIAMEEEVLFPVIAARLAAPRGPAALLRDEHLLILEMLAALRRLCRDPSRRARVVELAAELRDLLATHSGIEERILYAITDLLLSGEERDDLVRRCQRL